MEMKVQIISRETIKPSSPTPNHLRIHNLSALDQTAISCHIPIILFHTPTQRNSTKTCDHLKQSLAETLTHYYPLAGRAKNYSYIDCNDEGAIFIEAHVACDMSKVLKEANIKQLQQLLPCNPNQNLDHFTIPQLLLVQVNHFDCGGIAIGVCISHKISDASTLGTFVQSWGEIARGAYDSNEVVFDYTYLFPPIETIDISWSNVVTKDSILKTVTKRFVFDGSKIAALREKIGNGPYLNHPTRYEAVSALIWGAAMAAGAREREGSDTNYVAMSIVDLRKRMNPPLPQQSIGNICQLTTANFTAHNMINSNELAGKIRGSVRQINDENVRKFHSAGGFLKSLKNGSEETGKRRPNLEVFSFSSWCRFPFYGADFGWGRPIWVATAMGHNKVAILLDTCDGEGVEAWVGLSKEGMVQFEQHNDILEYASFNSST